MFADKKYRQLTDRSFEQWKDIPVSSIYSLDVLKREGNKFVLKMHLEGTQPDNCIKHIEHYASCPTCVLNAVSKGGYGVFVFCDKRFVYGYDLRNQKIISHVEEYRSFLKELASNGF